MITDTCCTCASLLPTPDAPTYSLESEKALPPSSPPRSLPCCNRLICAACIDSNPRYESYCPFCQVSSEPNPLPLGGLREPPAYSSPSSSPRRRSTEKKDRSDAGETPEDLPPTYTASATQPQPSSTSRQEDVLHHLRPTETLMTLSILYNVPASVLRSHNALFSDSLLPARRTLLIPASHYSGPSLSAEPVEDPEEVERKARLRRFMVTTKCADYKMAELYMGQAEGDVDRAVARWMEDERWEKENPLQKGKGVERKWRGGGLTGQLR